MGRPHIDTGVDVQDRIQGLAFTYIDSYLTKQEADCLFTHCVERIDWQFERVKMFGRELIAPRLSCSIGDRGLTYRYRGSQGTTFPFTTELHQLRSRLASDFQTEFNFVLANRYRSGSDYVGWHADDESDLNPNTMIVSLSLGASRTFRLRPRSGGNSVARVVSHGSLVVMFPGCQTRYKHTLTKSSKSIGERVNLSFRQVLC